jgi:predicted DNA binding CopG/RHH family protein
MVTTERKHLEKIIPVRVSNEQLQIIRKEADRKGIGASTLARMWIIEYLRKLDKKSGNK